MTESLEQRIVQAAEAEAAEFTLPEDWQVGRQLVEGFTIYPLGAKARANALHVARRSDGGHQLRMSIADVALIPADSAMAAMAEQRRNATHKLSYSPMLPTRIATDVLSLYPNRERPVVSVDVKLDPNNTISQIGVSRDRIRPRHLTPQLIQKFSQRPDTQDAQEFAAYRNLAQAIFTQRKTTGAFAFFDAARGLMMDEEGQLTSLENKLVEAEFVAAELRLLANLALTAYMQEQEIPAVYLAHTVAPGTKLGKVVVQMASSANAQLALRKSLGSVRYSAVPEIHIGLGVQAYLRASSPLTRFPDFADVHNLVAFGLRESFPYKTGRINTVLGHLNSEKGSPAVLAELARQGGSWFRDSQNIDPADLVPVLEDSIYCKKLPPHVVAVFNEMLKEDRIPHLLWGKILLSKDDKYSGFVEVRQAVWRRLNERPGTAWLLYNNMSQSKLLPEATITEQPGEEGTTQFTLVMPIDSERTITITTEGNYKEAQRQLALQLFSQLCDLEVPSDVATLEPKVAKHQTAPEQTTPEIEEAEAKFLDLLRYYGIPTETLQIETSVIEQGIRTIITIPTALGFRRFKATHPNEEVSRRIAFSRAILRLRFIDMLPDARELLGYDDPISEEENDL